MDYNIIFQFPVASVLDLVDAETSRYASHVRYDGGQSAYDAIKIHTNDQDTIKDYIQDAFRTIAAHFSDESSYNIGTIDSERVHVLSFYLPDFPYTELNPAHKQTASNEIKRYVVLAATARWMEKKSFAPIAQAIAPERDAAFVRLVTLLRTRQIPDIED